MGQIAERIAEMIQAGARGREIIAEIERMETEQAPSSEDFDEFWAAYPRKTAKPAAVKAYKAARKRKASHQTIMAGLARFVASCPDPQYTPHASTWLNQDRWNDVPVKSGPVLKGLAAAKEKLRQEIENDRQPPQARPDHQDARSLSFWSNH